MQFLFQHRARADQRHVSEQDSAMHYLGRVQRTNRTARRPLATRGGRSDHQADGFLVRIKFDDSAETPAATMR